MYPGDHFKQQLFCTGLGVLSGVQIKVVDTVWDRMSNWITDLEFHEGYAAFYHSKQVKGSVVKFISTISSMLFFAFIQPLALEARGLQYSGSTSQSHLQVQLKAIFITRFICLGALNDVAKPYVTFKMKQWRIARARHTQAARLAASFIGEVCRRVCVHLRLLLHEGC